MYVNVMRKALSSKLTCDAASELKETMRGGLQTFQVSRIGRESHALDVPLTHSRIAYHFSRILALVTHFG